MREKEKESRPLDEIEMMRLRIETMRQQIEIMRSWIDITPRLISIQIHAVRLQELGFASRWKKVFFGFILALVFFLAFSALFRIGWWGWVLLLILGYWCLQLLSAANNAFRYDDGISKWSGKIAAALIWATVLGRVTPVLPQVGWLGLVLLFLLLSSDRPFPW